MEQRAAAAALGLALPDAPAEPELAVWAENWPAVRLFRAMRTQLRYSFAGVEGLDYTALPVCEQRIGLTPTEARDAFWGVQMMETELIRWERGRS